MPTCTLSVPRCWKRLIKVEFRRGKDGELYISRSRPRRMVESEFHQKGESDPEAYYDDGRSISAVFDNGARVELHLCSGQSNYWGDVLIEDSEGTPIYESEALETIDKVMDFMADDGETYTVKIDWAGSDPYGKGRKKND